MAAHIKLGRTAGGSRWLPGEHRTRAPQTLRRRRPLLLQARFRPLVVADVEPAETPTVLPDVLGIALALRWVRRGPTTPETA